MLQPSCLGLTSRMGFLQMSCALIPQKNCTLEVTVELHFLCLDVHNAESQCTQHTLQQTLETQQFLTLARLPLLMMQLLLFSPGKSTNTLITLNP